MAASISIATEPVTIQVQPGGRASARISLVNRGDTVGQYQVSITGVDPAWYKLDNSQVGVFPNDRGAVQLSIRPPAEAISATYQLTIWARNQVDAADQAQAGLALTVQRPSDGQENTQPRSATWNAPPLQSDASASMATVVRPQASGPRPTQPPVDAGFHTVVLKAASPSGQMLLVTDRDGLKLAPGATQSMHIGVTNSGGAAMALELSAKGLPLSWLSLTPASLSLAPGETTFGMLTAAVPAQTPIGSYPLVLSAQAGEGANQVVRINMMLEVTQAEDISLELVPPRIQGDLTGEMTVTLSQSGTTPMRVSLSARDSSGQLDFVITPPTVDLPGNGKALVRLTVQARQTLNSADSQEIPFEVTAVPVGGNASVASMPGSFTQQRSIPIRLVLLADEVRNSALAEFPLKIVNPGQMPLSYRLSATDPDGSCQCQFDPPQLNLTPRSEASAILRVTPGAFLDAGEMIHTIRVLAQPVSGTRETLAGEVRYIQTAGRPPVLTLTPTSQTSSGPATYLLQIGNPRSTPLQIELRAFDPSQQCRFVIEPPTLLIAPMFQASARLEVHPTFQLLPAETNRACQFSVAAYPANQPTPILATGTLLLVHGFTWRKLLPFILGALVLLGLGAVVLIALLYQAYFH